MTIMGGGERVAIHSMLACEKLGHEVTLLAEDFDTQRFEDFFGCYGLFDKVRRLSYPEFKPSVISQALLYQRLYYYQKQFRRKLSNSGSFDLVLGTQDVGYVPNVPAPVVQYCYFPEYFRHLQSTPSSPLWKLYYSPARYFYRNRVNYIEKFLAVSDYSREFIRAIWGRDSTTLYPPCPVAQYRYSGEIKENLAITVGRIVSEKRMHIFGEIARKLPETRFVIIGSVANRSDAYYQSLLKSAPGNLSIVLSPLRKAKEIISRAKVYVHCAEGEHFGITIVEAMAAGCVPVVNDSGGAREIVTDNVGYKWRDINEAVDEISNVIQDSNLQKNLSISASERANMFSDDAFESSLTNNLKNYLF